MAEKKDKYVDTFDQYSQWLEKWLIQESLPWARRHKRWAFVIVSLLTGFLCLLFISLFPSRKAVSQDVSLQKFQGQIDSLTQKLQKLEEMYASLQTQLELLKQAYYQGRMPLLKMEINDLKLKVFS